MQPATIGGSPDAANVFADFAAGLDFGAIPSEVVECTKKLVIDQLGVMLVGRSAAGVPELAASVRDWGGAPEATVFGYGIKAPAPCAALVNGTMARACDYDSFHERAMVHLSAGCLPQCLAIAERRGQVTGKEFISAMVAGMEFMTRLGLSFEVSFLHTGRVTTLHQATFGGALAGAKLLRLDRRKTVSALGLACSQVAGNLQVSVEGTVLVRVLQGFAAQTAVQSALLAERGLVGPERALQGEFGYFKAYHDNRYDAGALTRDLGKHFEMSNVSIKFYPCCLLSHFAIDAMLRLVDNEGIRPEDVVSLLARVTQGTYNVVCSPIEAKRKPETMEAALFSLPYTVSAALLHRKFTLEQMTLDAIRDPAVQNIAQHVSIVVDAELEKRYARVIGPSIVEVTLKDGRRLSCRVDYCKGHPMNPMSFDDCAEKFRQCARFAAKCLPAEVIESVIDRVRKLESVPDVAQIISPFA